MIYFDYLYSDSCHIETTDGEYYRCNGLNYAVYNEVYLVPKTFKSKSGGVYHQDGSLIKETSLNKDFDVPKYIPNQKAPLQVIEKTCIYLGVYSKTWGHFITDCLKKIWFLKKENDFPTEYDFVFLSEEENFGINQISFLKLLGIDISRIHIITKNTLARKLIVPDSCFYFGDDLLFHYSKEYVDVIRYIKNQYINYNNTNYEKIYYSYSSYKKTSGYRKTFGEEKLEKFFSNQGYLIVHPEKYSLDEQLKMLASCKYFASTEGSISHNSLFLNDEAQIIIIPRGPYKSGYQQAIDSIGNHQIYYIDSALSALTSKNGPWSGPNYYYVSEELMSFFNISDKEKDYYRKRNFYDINIYFKYCMVKLKGRNYYTNNIYTEKFFYYYGLYSPNIYPAYYLSCKAKSKIEKLLKLRKRRPAMNLSSNLDK